MDEKCESGPHVWVLAAVVLGDFRQIPVTLLGGEERRVGKRHTVEVECYVKITL